MEFQEILYAEGGPVGTITLNRPDCGNKREIVAWARDGRIQPTPCRASGTNNPA
jgi:hypothetical protein